ncbi:MAG: RagB/SusD family nutrient uptake outer membrane protein [Bacteroidota bacterium]
MKPIHSYIFLLILGLIILAGCRDDFLDELPPHIISPESLYQNAEGFQAGLNGLYALVRQERSGRRRGSSNDLMISAAIIGTDNAYANWRAGIGLLFNEMGTRSTPRHGFYRDMWNWLYEVVNAANTIINRAENPNIDWPEEEKNRVLGEARCLRAWAYRHLTYLWGDVPLNLEESGFVIKTDWVRTPVADIRAQMEQDWLFAEEHLPDVPAIEGRLSKVVAQHYLAELYLALGEDQMAKEKALAVIDNGNYSLITERYGVKASEPGAPFMDMFTDGNSNRAQGNTEALWTFQLESEVLGGEGHNIMRRWYVQRYWSLEVSGKNPIEISEENGGRGLGRFGPTRFAIELYGPGDDRGEQFAWRYYWIINHSDLNQIPLGWWIGDTLWIDWKNQINEPDREPEWPCIRKWESPNPLDVTASRQYDDQVYLRLGETYLILAEAQFKLGESEAAAQSINFLRDRANASPITAADVDIDFILDERSRELWSEEHRRYTLIRLNKWVERTQLHNSRSGQVLDPVRDRLLPIPQDVIDANTSLDMPQNPGY